MAVLVSVGLDHRDWLGDSLESIGAEKAGIFRPGKPTVLGSEDMPASVFAALGSLGSHALVAGREFTWEVSQSAWSYRGPGLTLAGLHPPSLAGSIQYRNAATAIAAVAALDGAAPLPGVLDARTVDAALAAVRLPGRLQIVPGPVEWILDIAHNEPAARVLAAHLRERGAARATAAGRGRTLAVAGVLADKDAAGIAAALAPLIDEWIVCTLPGPRGGTAEDIASRLELGGAPLTRADSVVRGCELARERSRPGDRVVVFGSFHTVGPALEWLGLYSRQ